MRALLGPIAWGMIGSAAVMVLSNRSDTDTEELATTLAEMFRAPGER